MNGSGIQVCSSPQKEIGGFVISCQFNQTDFLACEDPDGLVAFLNSNGTSIFGLCNNDQAFFPRAFTDKDLIDITNEKLHGDGDIFMMDDISDQQEIRERKGRNLSNPAMPTHTRSGPEGSPAFQATMSQGPVTSLNNNDMSTVIFNPKKTLNFSNLDDTQSDANSINIKDLGLSTPKKGSDLVYHDSHQDDRNRHKYHQHFYHELTQNGPENLSTTFRELQPDGEASSYLGTGSFKPSDLGLNREFLSSFTKKDQESGFDIFSPLMSRNNNDDYVDDQERDITPPLYAGDDLQFGGGQNGHFLPSHINNQGNNQHILAKSGIQDFQSMEYSEDRSNNYPMFSDQESEKDYTDRRIERNIEDEEIEENGDGMEISHSKFQERYLQKTQVSVTIPQPVDTESGFPHGSPDREVLGSPEFDDSLDGGGEGGFNEDSDTHTFQSENRNYRSSDESCQSANLRTIAVSTGTAVGTGRDSANLSSRLHQNQQYDGKSGRGAELFKNRPNVTETFDPKKYGTVQHLGSSELVQNKNFPQDASKQAKSKVSHFQTSAKSSLNSNKVTATGNSGTSGVGSERIVKKHVEKKTLATKGQISLNVTASNRTGLGPGVGSSQSRQNFGSNSKTTTSQVRGGTGPGGVGVRSQLETDTQGRLKRNPQQQGIGKPNVKVSVLTTSRQDGQVPFTSSAGVTQSTSQSHGGQKMSSAKMDPSAHEPSIQDPAVVTQIQQISPVHLDQLPGQKATANVSVDVQGMEDIRHQLKQMLQMSTALDMQGPREIGQSDIQDQSETSMKYRGMEQEMQFSYNPQDEVSELYENFPSFFSSHVFSESINIPRSDTNLQAENQRLREMVEKERYRRKHCEQYIQQLNVKLLELQQQLAVAVSTDKRKDIMIEQLDKQLARVVEGWKRRDAEKDELMNKLRQDKQTIEETLKHQENVIANIEREMSEAVESLQADKDNATQTIETLTEEVSAKVRERAHVADCLEAEREKVQLLQQECDHVRESRQQLDAKLGQLQSRLHKEQDEWYQREQELLQRIEEVTQNNMKILQGEKVKNEEHGKLAEELMEQLQKTLTHSKKLELDLDAMHREKESLKIEMGIMEAKFENAQRKLEADLHSEMEKEIAVQVADVLKKMERQQDELRESHTRQILDLSQRQNKEIEEHMSLFKDELSQKEEEFRRQLMELEKTLQDYRNENTELKTTKQKLESQRLEILTKLQYLMQSQWNEAVSLLATSPHRKPPTTLNTSLPSVAPSNVHAVTGFGFNLGSPIPKQTLQQQAYDSPGRDSMVSHSTAKGHEGSPERTHPGLNVQAREDTSFFDEQAALSHLQEFQKYIDSQKYRLQSMCGSSGTGQQHLSSHSASSGRGFSQSSGSFPLSFDLFTRPTSENQSKQAQTSVQRSQESTEKLNLPFKSLPSDRAYQYYENQSKGSHDTSSKSAGFPGAGIHGLPGSDVTTGKHKKEEEWKYKQSVSRANEMLARAVQIRPPQQHASLAINSDLVHDGPSSADSMSYKSSIPQSFSPPTKQSKSASSQDSRENEDEEEEEEMSTVLEASSRLNDDYGLLSERVEQHETRQTELRHYVQILLNRSPVSAGGESDRAETGSLFSQDQTEELDLNDTAQAAQLQKELNRIQELREKQASGADKGRGLSSNQQEKDETLTTPVDERTGKILRPEQLANISKFLENYITQQQQEEREGERELKQPTEQQPSSQNPDQAQIAQLIGMLQHMQTSMSPLGGKKGQAERRSSPDKMKELNKVKRTLNFQLTTKAPESSQSKLDSVKSSQTKKVDRKVAGAVAAPKGGQNKAPAWK